MNMNYYISALAVLLFEILNSVVATGGLKEETTALYAKLKGERDTDGRKQVNFIVISDKTEPNFQTFGVRINDFPTTLFEKSPLITFEYNFSAEGEMLPLNELYSAFFLTPKPGQPLPSLEEMKKAVTINFNNIDTKVATVTAIWVSIWDSHTQPTLKEEVTQLLVLPETYTIALDLLKCTEIKSEDGPMTFDVVRQSDDLASTELPKNAGLYILYEPQKTDKKAQPLSTSPRLVPVKGMNLRSLKGMSHLDLDPPLTISQSQPTTSEPVHQATTSDSQPTNLEIDPPQSPISQVE